MKESLASMQLCSDVDGNMSDGTRQLRFLKLF